MIVSSQKNQKGYGLIEILVSMLVLAIGLLGVAGLQTQSIRFNHEAYLRTQATILAHDMVDRMRANRTLAISGSYEFALGDTPTASVTLCEDAACSPGNIVQYDFSQWRANIAASLPNGRGAVTPAGSTGTTWEEFVIDISYDSISVDTESEDGSPTTIAFQYRTRI